MCDNKLLATFASDRNRLAHYICIYLHCEVTMNYDICNLQIVIYIVLGLHC